jgi:hypothetical protein
MSDLENITHRKILEKILQEMDIKKTSFAIRLGFTKNNYTETLNKDFYSDKLIRRICKELELDVSVFGLAKDVTTIYQINGNDGKQNFGVAEFKELYDKLLAAKDEQIALLKDRLRDYERKAM